MVYPPFFLSPPLCGVFYYLIILIAIVMPILQQLQGFSGPKNGKKPPFFLL